MHKIFAENAAGILKEDKTVIGLAVAGSWITGELDQYSDLDIVVVTKEKISGDKTKMLEYASRLGHLLSAFTGEHVGEPRLLICLYKDPLLHVDIKFVTLAEFCQRIETPVILLDTDNQLQSLLEQTQAKFPHPDFQWIEDRFWTWIHYILLKIARGEYLEAFDFFAYLRMVVLGPLLQIKNGNIPRGVRKVETQLQPDDLEQLKGTIPAYAKTSLLNALDNAIALYKQLSNELYGPEINLQSETENIVLEYAATIK